MGLQEERALPALVENPQFHVCAVREGNARERKVEEKQQRSQTKAIKELAAAEGE